MVGAIVQEGLAGSEAVFFFGSVAVQRGGVTRAILSRIKLFAEQGIKVRLLLSAHQLLEDDVEADIRRIWRLPASVEFRYFWREAVPGGRAGVPVPGADATRGPGLTAAPSTAWGTGSIVRLYRDGLLGENKFFSGDGRLDRIEHVDSSGRATAREHYDISGRMIFVDQVNPVNNKPTLRRFFDRSGACWLTVWLDKAGRAGEAVVHRPAPVAYEDFGQLFAQWADRILADSDSPVIFSDSRVWDRATLSIRHPAARRVAVLHNCHTAKPYRSSDPTRSTWQGFAENINSFDKVVALTHRQRDHLIERFGPSNIVVINHPAAHATQTTRVPRRPGRLVAIARLVDQKRLDHAIRAFALAAEKVPEAHFDVFGFGARMRDLQSLVDELGISDRVTFNGFTHEPLEEFASAQATVLSSWYEGLPLVLTEAMAVGTPFVAYDINYGPAEVIRDGVDGILIPPGDVAAMGSALAKILGEPEYARALSERAREVSGRFSQQRWAVEWTSLYASLVNSMVNSPVRA